MVNILCIVGQQHSKTACLLVLMVIPGSLIFLCVIAGLHGGHTSLTPIFIIFYELAAILQVYMLVMVKVLIQLRCVV